VTVEFGTIDACEQRLATDFDPAFYYAAPLTEVMLLGVVANRAGQGKKIYYDSRSMRITNDEEANRFLTREYRGGFGM